MKKWSEDLDEIVRGRVKYLDREDSEDLDSLVGVLISLVMDRMRDAFIAGHAQGAMSNIPDTDVYDFDDSLDSFHAKTKFDKWLREYEAASEA